MGKGNRGKAPPSSKAAGTMMLPGSSNSVHLFSSVGSRGLSQARDKLILWSLRGVALQSTGAGVEMSVIKCIISCFLFKT